MDEYTENRFKNLKDLSEEERIKKIEELEEEIERATKVFYDPTTRGEAKIDAHNDYKYAVEQLEYLNHLNTSKRR